MKLKITVTKDIYRKSMMCGIGGEPITENCAIALAVRDIFPCASVGAFCIQPFKDDNLLIDLPTGAMGMIIHFDELKSTPEKRLDLPEFSFEIDLPQEIIDSINISELTESLKNHETLKLIEA